jgi:hypothetical protein
MMRRREKLITAILIVAALSLLAVGQGGEDTIGVLVCSGILVVFIVGALWCYHEGLKN